MMRFIFLAFSFPYSLTVCCKRQRIGNRGYSKAGDIKTFRVWTFESRQISIITSICTLIIHDHGSRVSLLRFGPQIQRNPLRGFDNFH
ncbi:hypothetical protein F4781DRAFT_397217 [Annulohypoxylon bovei var. microspora]|nr:hypothetical protein F4781DRAFT_397217 [Annulohypoxylon bovei var. microspora]